MEVNRRTGASGRWKVEAILLKIQAPKITGNVMEMEREAGSVEELIQSA
jgi:hypothetical protein